MVADKAAVVNYFLGESESESLRRSIPDSVRVHIRGGILGI